MLKDGETALASTTSTRRRTSDSRTCTARLPAVQDRVGHQLGGGEQGVVDAVGEDPALEHRLQHPTHLRSGLRHGPQSAHVPLDLLRTVVHCHSPGGRRPGSTGGLNSAF